MKKAKTQIVLDTNIFVNPDSRYLFGKTPKEAFNNFLEYLDNSSSAVCFMPPSVSEELNKFIGYDGISKKSILINKKPPSKYELKVPSLLLYEFIDEMRNRINKGLRVGEKYVRKAIRLDDEREIIKNLREEYRIALREGILDSKEDCDLLILAKELNAYLATTDNGLISWAHKLGINCISTQELKTFLEK